LVSDLGAAVASGVPYVEQYLARQANYQDDGFTALNTAFLNDGALVYLPDGVEAAGPVHLVFVTTGRQHPRVCHPRTLIVVGRNARATVVESYLGAPEADPTEAKGFTNAVTEMDLGEGSEFDHYRLLLENPQGFHVGTSRVSQGRDSTFSSASFSLGNTLGRNDFEVLLDGPGSSCTLNGLYLTTEGQHMDNLISIDHAKPYTSSQLTYKGILHGKSRAVFGGQVLVRKDAQKVKAQQSDKNLLLSRQAEVDSKPSLLIYADDVQCSHGATAGHLEEDSLFYLRSRGLDLDTANRMLVQAFAREIIETVKLEPLVEYLDQVFTDAIPTTGLQLGGRR
jgi:Fe-S cluster assembly protein SufD